MKPMCELGARLRAAREERGRSLRELARELRVSAEVLEALEACRFDALPEPVLAKGHLRRYAKALGLDPEPLVALYPAPEPAPPAAPPPRRRGRPWPFLLAAAAALAVAAGLWLWLGPKPEANAPAPEPPPPQEAPAPAPKKPARVKLVVRAKPEGAKVYLDGYFLGQAPVELEVEPGRRQLRVEADGYQTYERELNLETDRNLSVALSPLPKPEPKATPAPRALRLRVTARSWLRVRTPGGKTLYEKTAPPGTELRFPLPVVVRTGNAGGVRVYLGAKDLGPLGKPGEVVTRRFEAPKTGE